MKAAKIGLILALIFAAGCVEKNLTGGDRSTCMEATYLNVSRIPLCGDDEACQAEWDQSHATGDIHHARTQLEVFRVEQGIVSTWERLNAIKKTFREAHDACQSQDVIHIFEKGVAGANQLKLALREYERSMEAARAALAEAAQYGKESGVEYVRDTNAFEAYARILEMGQEWSSGETTYSETEIVRKNKAYFDHVGEVLGEAEPGMYSVHWASVFSIYDTALKNSAPADYSFVSMLSPVWQSAVSTYATLAHAEDGIRLLYKINANEMVEHMEEGVAPENGAAYRVLKRIEALENGIVELGREEDKKSSENRTSIAELKAKENEMEWIAHEAAGWDVNFTYTFEKDSAKKDVEWFESRLEELVQQKATNTFTVGERVASQRELQREIGTALAENARKMDEVKPALEKCEDRSGKGGEEWPLLVRARECSTFMEQVVVDKAQVGAFEYEFQHGKLEECAAELSQLRERLELPTTEYTALFFETTFGLNAARAACEASRQNHQLVYESNEHVREWKDEIVDIRTKIRALNRLRAVHSEWVTPEQEKKGEEVEEAIRSFPNLPGIEWIVQNKSRAVTIQEELNDLLESVIQKQLNEISWKVESPAALKTNEVQHVVLSFQWENPFGETIALEHVFIIPAPMLFEKVEDEAGNEVEWGERGISWETMTLPAGGAGWKGESTGISVRQQEHTNIKKVVGTRVEMETILEIDSAIRGVHVEWQWKPFPGINPQSLRANQGEWLPVEWKGNNLTGVTMLTDSPGHIVLSYEWPHAVEWSVEPHGAGEDAVYAVHIRSNLIETVTTSIFTGIVADPINSREVEVVGDEGEGLSFSRSEGNGIVLNSVELVPNTERVVWIRMKMDSGIEGWRALGSSIVSEAELAREKGEQNIRLRAGVLISEIQSGWNERSSETWAKLIPNWQQKVEGIFSDWEKWNVERLQLEVERSAIHEEWGGKMSGWSAFLRGRWEAGERAKEERNNELWASVLNEVKKELAKIPMQIIPQNENEERAEEIMGKLLEKSALLTENISKYEQAVNPDCEKLSQVGFTCPIGQTQWKEWETRSKELSKEIEKEEAKRKTKGSAEEQTWIASRRETWEAWEKEMDEGNALVERGINSLHETANGLVIMLSEKENESSEEVKAAIEKAKNAFEKGEFGKTIFISTSLRTYWENTNPLNGAGLLPLGGVALVGLVGGAWYYFEREKKKKEILPAPITIPRVEEEEKIMRPMVAQSWDERSGSQLLQPEIQSGRRAQAKSKMRLLQGQSKGARGKGKFV